MPTLAKAAREKLDLLESRAQKRVILASEREESAIVLRGGKRLISFSCNDYLGLSHHRQVKQAAIKATEKHGTGAGASRLVTGNHPLYAELEAKLARWKHTEAALVFGSGYLANIGIIPALIGKGDLILADKLVHACLLDGAKLSDAKLLRFKHNDVADCEALLAKHRKDFKRCLIITDEVFSMDGDVAPIEELYALAKHHDAWLMADGAHRVAPAKSKVDIYVGTLSKAFGAYGGYVCGSRELIECLTTSARSFMFSTGLPPGVVASAIAALDIMQGQTELLAKPLSKAQLFTKLLNLKPAESPIVPLILGEESKAVKAAQILEKEGFLVTAIRPPTVPSGTSRLRFAFCAQHKDEDIKRLAELIQRNGFI